MKKKRFTKIKKEIIKKIKEDKRKKINYGKIKIKKNHNISL